ncbi:hypothetical protein EON66_08675 [archaeon]|nr:MAG: hypothetical protein EON66_08675 [archaeon]
MQVNAVTGMVRALMLQQQGCCVPAARLPRCCVQPLRSIAMNSVYGHQDSLHATCGRAHKRAVCRQDRAHAADFIVGTLVVPVKHSSVIARPPTSRTRHLHTPTRRV